MAAALPKIAEAAPHGMVRIYYRSGCLVLSIERSLSILRSRRRMRDPTAAALAEAIAQSRARADAKLAQSA
jgi:hypothetical protein